MKNYIVSFTCTYEDLRKLDAMIKSKGEVIMAEVFIIPFLVNILLAKKEDEFPLPLVLMKIDRLLSKYEQVENAFTKFNRPFLMNIRYILCCPYEELPLHLTNIADPQYTGLLLNDSQYAASAGLVVRWRLTIGK